MSKQLMKLEREKKDLTHTKIKKLKTLKYKMVEVKEIDPKTNKTITKTLIIINCHFSYYIKLDPKHPLYNY